jgi:hypothetical protein
MQLPSIDREDKQRNPMYRLLLAGRRAASVGGSILMMWGHRAVRRKCYHSGRVGFFSWPGC